MTRQREYAFPLRGTLLGLCALTRWRLIPSLLLAITLSGCAQLSGGAGTTALTIDPGDPCGPERQAFSDSPYFARDTIVKSAAVGAGVGAGTGIVAGALTGNWKNALIGGAAGGLAGAAAGAAAGYYQTMQQQYQDQSELAYHVNQDLTAQSSDIDHTLATFGRLRYCRFAQAAQIKSLARRHVITRDQALQELALERDRFDQELTVAKTYGVNMAKQGSEFAYASEKVQANPATAARIRLAATETIPEKRQSYDNAVQQAQTASKTTFALDTNTQTSWLPIPSYV